MVAKRAKGVTAKVPFPQRINRHTSQRPVTRSRTASCMVPILQRDTLEEVLKFLTPRELTGCASVCSAWRDVALSAALWKSRCEVCALQSGPTCAHAWQLHTWTLAYLLDYSLPIDAGAVAWQGVRACSAASPRGQHDICTGLRAVTAACGSPAHHN